MTIGFFIPSYLPNLGGAEVLLHNYLINLKNKKKKIILLISFETWIKLKFNKINLPYELRVIYFPLIFKIEKILPKLSIFILSFFVRKVNSNDNIKFWYCVMLYPSGYLLANALKNTNIPVITRAVGIDIQKYPEINYGYRLDKKINLKIKESIKYIKYFIASSEDVKNEYLKLNIDKEKIIYIPNAINTKIFNDKNLGLYFKKKYNIKETKKIFLTVTRNHPKKGLKYLLEAIKIYSNKRKNEDVIFILYGKNIDKLNKEIEKLNIKNYCLTISEDLDNRDFEDYLPSRLLRSAYAASDYFILPSLIETFGIVLIEAMAAKCAIISTKTEGCNSVLMNGEYGIQVEIKNSNELFKSIILFLDNDSMVDNFLNKCQKRVLDFSLENAIKKLLDLKL